MAAFIGRTSQTALLRAKPAFSSQKVTLATSRSKHGNKVTALLGAATVACGGAAVAQSLAQPTFAFDYMVHPPKFPWNHSGPFETYDYASVRRGYEVYKQVCAACHSIEYLHYRDMANVFLTTEEAKKEAAEITVIDGPNDEGEMFERPGILNDSLPKPYANEKEARYKNNGANPPDLSLIIKARHGNEDYVFSLLTGYADPPAGFVLDEGQYYNPYFPGAAISMAQALYTDIIEYSDGTPATQSQLAKDVTIFLTWVGDRWADERKSFAAKGVITFGILTLISWYYNRQTWLVLKNAKRVILPPKRR